MSDPPRDARGDGRVGRATAPSPPAPTPANPTTTNANATGTTDGGLDVPIPGPGPAPLDLSPVFIEGQPPQRPLFPSLVTMLLLWTIINSGNAPAHQIEIGDDGEIRPRVTELDRMRGIVGEYRGYINGTGNWTEPAAPALLPASIVPSRYDHAVSSGPFFQNITGWYRRADITTVDLLAETPSAPWFSGVHLPSLNTSSWNATRAKELRGEFDWAHVTTWDMYVRERWVTAATWEGDKGKGSGNGGESSSPGSGGDKTTPPSDGDSDTADISNPLGSLRDLRPEDPPLSPTAWAWVKGSAVVTSRPPPLEGEEPTDQSLDYEFFGLHHLANGTYELYALPEGITPDLRNIPRMFPNHHNITAQIVLAELEKELRVLEDSLLLTDSRTDESRSSSCPLLVHLSLPPLPPGASLAEIQAFEAELANPTGILTSLVRPPQYWSLTTGLGGVIIADQCGFAFGFDHGKGVGLADYWRRGINYAAFATLSQLIVLVLLVRQMEVTRTPSTLAKVSMWTIIMIGISDAWTLSSHLAVGVMSSNKTSLPTIVPGFLALCTAMVFAPRYAILLHRIQAPERTVVTLRPRPPTNNNNSDGGSGTDTGTGTAAADDEPPISFAEHVGNILQANPILKWLGSAVLVITLFNILRMPALIPFLVFGMHSVWVPQIWRNARRGSARGLNPSFIIGLSIARLALPLYGLWCPDNIFFIETVDWIWALLVWVAAQVVVLFAQDRFGPAFFLPKRFAPQEGYDYHPLLPNDPESNVGFEGGTTCSICMEEVETRAGSFAPADEASSSASSALLAMNARRNYAVAPCHHLFHTKCLQQWMAIKTICPLCKRPLPPL